MCPSLWLILLDVLGQQDGGVSAIPAGPQQVPVCTQLKAMAKDGDVFATIVDVADIVAHDAGQVRLHEQISSSISSDMGTTDREHLWVTECFQISV
jgi:hypothetical protein